MKALAELLVPQATQFVFRLMHLKISVVFFGCFQFLIASFNTSLDILFTNGKVFHQLLAVRQILLPATRSRTNLKTIVLEFIRPQSENQTVKGSLKNAVEKPFLELRLQINAVDKPFPGLRLQINAGAWVFLKKLEDLIFHKGIAADKHVGTVGKVLDKTS